MSVVRAPELFEMFPAWRTATRTLHRYANSSAQSRAYLLVVPGSVYQGCTTRPDAGTRMGGRDEEGWKECDGVVARGGWKRNGTVGGREDRTVRW